MAERIDVHAERDFLWNGHKVYIIQGAEIFAIERKPFAEGSTPEPTMSGRDGREFLQAALDCAWAAGMRPIGFSDTAEQVRTMGRHLEDMRAITFAKLDVEKP